MPRPLLLPAALVFSWPWEPTPRPPPRPTALLLIHLGVEPNQAPIQSHYGVVNSSVAASAHPLRTRSAACHLLPRKLPDRAPPTPPTLAMLKGTGPQHLVSWLGIRLCGQTVRPAASACL